MTRQTNHNYHPTEPEYVKIECSDTGAISTGTVIQRTETSLRVSIAKTNIVLVFNRHTNAAGKVFFVAQMHGLELTTNGAAIAKS